MTGLLLRQACLPLAILLLWSWAAPARSEAAPAVEQPAETSGWQSHLGGSARFDYFSSDKQLDDATGFYGSTFREKLEGSYHDWLSSVVDGRETKPDLGDRQGFHDTLVEGYITLQNDSTSLRLGKQIVAWGRADLLNPTDNLTPRNYVLLLPDDADQRSGTTAALLTQAINNQLSLSVFASPFFTPSIIPLSASMASYVNQRPDQDWAHGEAGIRLNQSGGAVDASLSYFHGYRLTPDLTPLGLDASGVPVVALQYGKINVFGLDAATNAGPYGMRAELAYTETAAASAQDATPENPFWYYVAGADRSFDGGMSINLQIFGRHVRDFHDGRRFSSALQQVVANYSALINNQQFGNSYGITARIGENWLNDTLRAEWVMVCNLTGRNAYMQPKGSYDINDRLMVSLGAQLYTGGNESYFGSLKKNQTVFFELRYSL